LGAAFVIQQEQQQQQQQQQQQRSRVGKTLHACWVPSWTVMSADLDCLQQTAATAAL
jgi:hypothetical protein